MNLHITPNIPILTNKYSVLDKKRTILSSTEYLLDKKHEKNNMS